MSNHLGNVLVTVSDKKLKHNTEDHYYPDVINFTDYYAFGMAMPNRTGYVKMNSATPSVPATVTDNAGESYRYAFNGMERNTEMSSGTMYDTEFRILDPRLGRWLSVDPITHSWQSPYCSFNNNPIYFIDPSGLSGVGTSVPGGGGNEPKTSSKTGVRYPSAIRRKAAVNRVFLPTKKPTATSTNSNSSWWNEVVKNGKYVARPVVGGVFTFVALMLLPANAVNNSGQENQPNLDPFKQYDPYPQLDFFEKQRLQYFERSRYCDLTPAEKEEFAKLYKKIGKYVDWEEWERKYGQDLHKNNDDAEGHFVIYKIEFDGQLYKYGKADMGRITKMTQLPVRVHDQLRKLRRANPTVNITAEIVKDLGVTTTKNAKVAERDFIQQHYDETQVIPKGNQDSFTPK